MDELTQAKKDALRADASYNKKKDAKEPIISGAFRGGMASSVASRMFRPEGKQISVKHDRGLILGGTALGALFGKLNHDKDIRNRDKARRLLNKEGEWNEDMGSDVGLGSLIGGATSAFGSKNRIGSRKKWALGGALAGAATGALSNIASNAAKKEDREGMKSRSNASNFAELGMIGGVADGMATPIINKLRGRAMSDKKMIKGLTKDVNIGRRKKGAMNKLDLLGSKEEDLALLDGIASKRKSGRFFFFFLFKMTGKSLARQGIMGAAFGYGLGKLMDKKE